MATCWKCGQESAAGMRFCTNCGAALSEETVPQAGGGSGAHDPSKTLIYNQPPQTSPSGWPTSSYTPPVNPPQSFAPQRSHTGLIIGVVVAVLLLGVLGIGGVAGWYYLSSANANSSDKKKDETKNSGKDKAAKPDTTPTPDKPKQLFDPPMVPTKDGSFTVYANRGWQLSDIAVVPRERYSTTVEGLVDIAGIKASVRADGINDPASKHRRLMQEFPTGALLMRTRYADGNFSNVMATRVNGRWQNFEDERGMLEFVVNDNATDNNGGHFTIRVKMTSVPGSK